MLFRCLERGANLRPGTLSKRERVRESPTWRSCANSPDSPDSDLGSESERFSANTCCTLPKVWQPTGCDSLRTSNGYSRPSPRWHRVQSIRLFEDQHHPFRKRYLRYSKNCECSTQSHPNPDSSLHNTQCAPYHESRRRAWRWFLQRSPRIGVSKRHGCAFCDVL